jgi:hypothetical protein
VKSKLSTPISGGGDDEPTALGWLKVRCYAEVPEQNVTPSSPFHIWLLAGDWLFWGSERRGSESYPRFPPEFGGDGLSLFLISLR